jgi:hypothetical protein
MDIKYRPKTTIILEQIDRVLDNITLPFIGRSIQNKLKPN